MGEVIYKQTKMRKKEIYLFIKSLFLDNGWENISSRMADGDVFYSKGEDGQSELYINLKEYNTNAAATITSSNNYNLMIRPLEKYVPSATAGGAGTIIPSTAKWGRTAVTDATDSILDVFYYADKDKVTFLLRRPLVNDNFTCYWYFGKPEWITSKRLTKYAISISSFIYGVEPCLSPYHDTRDGQWGMTVYHYQSPKAQPFKKENEYFVFEFVLGDDGTIYGPICKIDGLLYLSNDSSIQLRTSDSFDDHSIKVGDKVYQTMLLRGNSYSWNNLPFYNIGLRIS